MNKKIVIENLLTWMEQNLNQRSTFFDEDVQAFFATHFVIRTNSRTIEATPKTYREYLYQLKATLKNVLYEREELLETTEAVIAAFVIHLNFNDKIPQKLRAISIFKFDENGRIVEWNEVFADAQAKAFSYDP